ncbi:MAG: radical SAM protein [Candidatus Moranbacteria bacterium]|nr:radical SAM protein [Candidatus Moranbacteria bacterium]MDD3964835.1 radical SAM protein [Candidatus Moranbacteria bacterium]
MTELESIKKIRFVLTDFCNYQCRFCHNEGTPTKNTRFLDKESIFSLTSVAKDLGIKKITLTGGEPLLHPEIVAIVDGINAIYPEAILGMTTNGMLFDKNKFATIITNLSRLRLNFQSLDEKVLKYICGNGANISKALLMIDDVRKLNPDLNICLNFVLTTYNKESLSDVIKFAIKNNLDVKLLEYMALNKDLYVEVKYAKDILESLRPIKKYKDYQDDDIYMFTGSSSRIRLCYSFCNGFRCKSCRECGEIRLAPGLTLKHCFDERIEEVDIRKELLEQNLESIKKKIISIDQIKGRLL